MRLLVLASALALAVPAIAAQPRLAVAVLELPSEGVSFDSDGVDRAIHLAVQADTPEPRPAILFLARVEAGEVVGLRQVETVAVGHPDPAALARTGDAGGREGWDAYLSERHLVGEPVRALFADVDRSAVLVYDERLMGSEEEVQALVTPRPDPGLMLRIAEAGAPDAYAAGETLLVLVASALEREVQSRGAVMLLRKRPAR